MWYAPPPTLHASNPINLLKKPPPALQMIGFAARQTTFVAGGWEMQLVVGATGFC
jgi:hypothetical protein